MRFAKAFVATFCLFCVSTARGQVVVPGADGSDGAFNPTSSVEIDLAQAPDGAWNGTHPSPGLGTGVYDSTQWAVVFRYSSVNIPSGVNVTFRNRDFLHLPNKPGNPPVVWLVSGTVSIGGLVNVSPRGDYDLGLQVPGPGGFRGGGSSGVWGLGPGGGDANHCQGYYSSGYGNSRNIPLIGGSGGRTCNCSSTAGAGAILIASTGTMTINGGVYAIGPSLGTCAYCLTHGSGGAIRLVCNRLEGSGQVLAHGECDGCGGGCGDAGRIRIESNQVAFASIGNPVASFGLPGASAQLWPDNVTAPSVKVLTLGGSNIPVDPAARFEFPLADVNIAGSGSQTLVIEAKNIPTGADPPGVAVWDVKARVAARTGGVQYVNATFVSGNYAFSTWQAQLPLANGFSAIQVRASMPPQ